MPKLFLDCDGVLADFDTHATLVLGEAPAAIEARHGRREFWRRIAASPDFFARLPLMPDARALWDGVAHLRPVILTGRPGGDWAEPQKLRWAAEHFPDARMVVTLARLKRDHLEAPGDVLVDDRPDFCHLWEEAGGVFVLHRDAARTLAALRDIGLDARG